MLLLTSPPLAWAKKDEKTSTPSTLSVSPSLIGGVYGSNLVISLSTQVPAPDTAIHFTLDGTPPQPSSPRYTSALSVTNSTLLRWQAIRGDQAGPVGSSHYLLLDPGLRPFQSSLPLMILNTCGDELSRDSKSTAYLLMMDAPTGTNTLTAVPEDAGLVRANVRGRASLRYPKRSYTLKLTEDSGDDRSASLGRMPKDEDWILYAPYPDKTLLRDLLAYEMSRAQGHWAPRTRHVEVFVTDGRGRLKPSDYVGVYVLEERIKRHPKRVNIQKLHPWDVSEPAVSGGYIFKKDHVDRGYYGPPDLLGGPNFTSSGNKPGFPTGPGGFPADPRGFLPVYTGPRENSESSSSSGRRSSSSTRSGLISLTGPVPTENNEGSLRRIFRGEDDQEVIQKVEQGWVSRRATNQFYFVEPEEDEITAVQKQWLQHHIDRVEAALHSEGFRDPSTGYAAFIDAGSFIDYHLLVEISKNVDGHRFSTFYTLDRGGKIRMEPVWDWNLSFGNSNGKQGWLSEHWLWPQLTDLEYSWFRRLFEDPDFGQRYVDRWTELSRSEFSSETLLKRIDTLTSQLSDAQVRNFERWPILGKAVTPNFFYGDTYAEEVALMKSWLENRIVWINAQFLPPPALKSSAQPDGSVMLSSEATNNDTVYTTDGTDPRLPGGALSRKATKLSNTVKLPNAARVFARNREGQRWSGPTQLNQTQRPASR